MWIIEHGGRYWNGKKFGKRSQASAFLSVAAAWAYVDRTFADDISEDFTLHKK